MLREDAPGCCNITFARRKVLCADYADMVHKKLNVGKRRRKKTSHLSNDVKGILNHMLRYEYALYDHFRAKLRRQLREINTESELKALKRARLLEEAKCLEISAACAGVHCFCNEDGGPNKKFLQCHTTQWGYTTTLQGFKICTAAGR